MAADAALPPPSIGSAFLPARQGKSTALPPFPAAQKPAKHPKAHVILYQQETITYSQWQKESILKISFWR